MRERKDKLSVNDLNQQLHETAPSFHTPTPACQTGLFSFQSMISSFCFFSPLPSLGFPEFCGPRWNDAKLWMGCALKTPHRTGSFAYLDPTGGTWWLCGGRECEEEQTLFLALDLSNCTPRTKEAESHGELCQLSKFKWEDSLFHVGLLPWCGSSPLRTN